MKAFWIEIVLALGLLGGAVWGLLTYIDFNAGQEHSSSTRGVVRLNLGNVASCSGFILTDTVLMTAAHCDEPNLAVVAIQGMHQESAIIIAKLPSLDIALYSGDFHKFYKTRYDFKRRYMHMGRSYTSCGHPFASPYPVCVDLGPKTASDAMNSIFQQEIYPGMSGGPVFDEDGYAVGINMGIFPLNPITHGGSIITPTFGMNGLLWKFLED